MSVDTLRPVDSRAARWASADDLARPVASGSVARAVEHALRHAGYEVLPLRNAEQAILTSVPVDVPLSVTMTASKGVDGTVELTKRLAAHGYSVTPHLAARMFRDKAHLAGFHFFTFNEVARTEAWRQAWLTRLRQATHDD